MDCECISVTVVPDDRYERRCRADGTGREQGDNKEQCREHERIQGRGEEAVSETKFVDERQGLWEGKKQMQSGSSAERRTSSVEMMQKEGGREKIISSKTEKYKRKKEQERGNMRNEK